MTFENLLQECLVFINSFFNSINSGLKFFFNDLPVIFGLRLGWWFLIFSLLGLFVSKIGGDE